MSLYNALDKANHLSEFTEVLFVQDSSGATDGVLTAAERQLLARANLGLSALENATLTTEAGAGITGNTGGGSYSSSVMQVGDTVITRIFIDVDGLDSSTTDLDIIGFDEATDQPAHLGQITTAQNGVIYAGTVTCVEAPVGGVTDIDLYGVVEATGVFDNGVAALDEVALLTSGGAWSLGLSKPLSRVPRADDYLYLTGGAAGTAAEYTAGQFYITLYGIAT